MKKALGAVGVATAMLIGLVGPAAAEILDRTPDTEFASTNCPDDPTPADGALTGWTKINSGTGTATGAFGSIVAAGGTSVSYELTAGYVVDICIKAGDTSSGGGSVIYRVSGSGTLDAPGTPAKDVSHFSYRVVSRFTPTGHIEVSKTAEGAYTTPVSWLLDKTVDRAYFEGAPGDVFTPTWTVTATEVVGAATGFVITGSIDLDNASNLTATLDVSDSLAGAVIDCDTATAGHQSTVTLAPGAGASCTYSVAQTDASATTNTASATATSTVPAGHQAFLGTVHSDATTIAWTGSRSGDASVTLADGRFSFSQLITDSSTQTFPDSIPCPTDRTLYTDRVLQLSVTNEATLVGATTNLRDQATVDVTCRIPEVWRGETATGRGTDWTKNANWFMFTPVTDLRAGAVDLVAGQHFDAGDITLSGNQLTIALHGGFRLASVANNVKVQPLRSCNAGQAYVQPGQYSIKQTSTGSTIAVTVPYGTDVCAYAIHVDVERMVS